MLVPRAGGVRLSVLVVFEVDVELLLELGLELDDVEWVVCWDVVCVTVETVTVESIVTVTTEIYAPILDSIRCGNGLFGGKKVLTSAFDTFVTGNTTATTQRLRTRRVSALARPYRARAGLPFGTATDIARARVRHNNTRIARAATPIRSVDRCTRDRVRWTLEIPRFQ
jgi:hypothetical protein